MFVHKGDAGEPKLPIGGGGGGAKQLPWEIKHLAAIPVACSRQRPRQLVAEGGGGGKRGRSPYRARPEDDLVVRLRIIYRSAIDERIKLPRAFSSERAPTSISSAGGNLIPE